MTNDPSNPTAKARPKPAATAQEARNERFLAVRKVIDQDIRPFVQADGGDIELVALDGNTVKVRLHGACNTCPSSLMTLRQGVQAQLQARVAPELVVEEVKP